VFLINEIFIDIQKLVKNKDIAGLRNILNEKKTTINKIINLIREQKPQIHTTQKVADYFNVMESIGDMKYNYLPILTEGDGNCLYNAISLTLFGTSKWYKAVRIGLVFTILNEEIFIKNIIEKTCTHQTFETILLGSIEDRAWANEYHILISSAVLRMPIYMYSTIVHQVYCANTQYAKIKPVCILHTGNHYTALMPLHSKSKTTKINFEQFQKFQLE
jgi:hypothetical protein